MILFSSSGRRRCVEHALRVPSPSLVAIQHVRSTTSTSKPIRKIRLFLSSFLKFSYPKSVRTYMLIARYLLRVTFLLSHPKIEIHQTFAVERSRLNVLAKWTG